MIQNLRTKIETLASVAACASGKTDRPAWPLEIFLEVSNLCDLKCAMCPTFSPLNPTRFENLRRERRGLLDLDNLGDALDDALRHALVVHTHGYGEPTTGRSGFATPTGTFG